MKIKIYLTVVVFTMCLLFTQACNDDDILYSKNGKIGDEIAWVLSGETLSITGNGSIPDFDYYGGKKAPWGYFEDDIERITVSEGITDIGDFAFSYLEAESVRLPKTLLSIGDYAFFACEELEEIDIPSSVVSIGAYAFSECFDLREVYIPESVTDIGLNPFLNCPSLINFYVDKNNPAFKTDKGILYNSDKSVLVVYPSGNKSSDFFVPDEVNVISDYAFAYCNNLKNVVVGSGVKSFGVGVFACCSSLESVKLSVGIEKITDRMFFGCKRLASISVPAGTKTIGNSAFANCDSLICVEFPTSLTEIENLAFSECEKLETITLPPAVKVINYRAFSGCSRLKSLVLPMFLEKIESYAFSYCRSLESLSVASNLENVDEFAFKGCNSLRNIEYEGTRTMWKNIKVEGGNDCLVDAVVSFPNDIKDN